jgi:LysR family glycine cleavage system transcriptional activator
MGVRKIDITIMDRRNIHFNALRAFEAAARHASVSAAAKELSVTHSAVSHQIKLLEQSLGVSLFQRTNRGLNITAHGETLLPVLMQSFDQISAVLDEIRPVNSDDIIRVTTTPSFASKWLVPRLSDWYAENDAARVHLIPSLGDLDFETQKIDLAIRCGKPPWTKLEHEFFMPIHLVPVCSPQYRDQHPGLDTSADVLKHNLIHADIDNHNLGDEWCAWLQGSGMTCPAKFEGLSFHDPALAMQAAADGLGLAIGYLELIGRDLQMGKLVTASGSSVKHQLFVPPGLQSVQRKYPPGASISRLVNRSSQTVRTESNAKVPRKQ